MHICQNLRNGITIVSNSNVILELMKAHLQWLTAIRQQSCRVVPLTCTCLPFQRLSLSNDFLVAAASPESLIVVGTSRLVWFVRFHLGFSEILLDGQDLLDLAQKIQPVAMGLGSVALPLLTNPRTY